MMLPLHLFLSGSRLAHAQASGSDGESAAADTSWFAKYHPAAQDTLAPSTYEGWKQFQLNCSRCHGQDATGTSFAPSLVQALGNGGPVPTQAVFLQIACNGVPGTGMPSWCKLGLDTDKLREIYLYVDGRGNGTIHSGRPVEGADSSGATR
jgi:mono/diheme cytochrome c family protein